MHARAVREHGHERQREPERGHRVTPSSSHGQRRDRNRVPRRARLQHADRHADQEGERQRRQRRGRARSVRASRSTSRHRFGGWRSSRPDCPCSARAHQRAYCTGDTRRRGRIRAAAAPPRPAIAIGGTSKVAGSPGASRTSTNVSSRRASSSNDGVAQATRHGEGGHALIMYRGSARVNRRRGHWSSRCGRAAARARRRRCTPPGTDLESANPLVTDPPALPPGAALRAVHHARALRLDAGAGSVRGAGVGLESPTTAPPLSPRHRPRAGTTVGRPRRATWPSRCCAARDPVTGYPRAGDLAGIDTVVALDDSTAVVRFAPGASRASRSCSASCPSSPSTCCATVPRAAMRRAPFNDAPVGNGPFRFVRAGAQPALGVRPQRRLSRRARRAAGAARPRRSPSWTKRPRNSPGSPAANSTSPASRRSMAALVRRDPTLRLIDYPILFETGIVLNTHRPPFDDVRVRRAISLAIDRERLVRVALAGFGTPAGGPVAPEVRRTPIPRRRCSIRRAPTRCSTRPGGAAAPDGTRMRGGRPLAFELLTVGQRRQRAGAARAGRPGRPGHRDGHPADGAGGVPDARARARPKRFDALVTGVSGDLVAVVPRAPCSRSRQAGGALDYADFHEPALDAAVRAGHAPPEPPPSARAAWHDVQRELRRQEAGRVALPRAGRAGRHPAAAPRDDGSARRAGDAARNGAWCREIPCNDSSPRSRRCCRCAAPSPGARSRPLADSLAADLERPLARRTSWCRAQKALLSRAGGRCERDGSRLDFDPLVATRASLSAMRQRASRRAARPLVAVSVPALARRARRPRGGAVRRARRGPPRATSPPISSRSTPPPISNIRIVTTCSGPRARSSARTSSPSGCCSSASRSTCSRRRAATTLGAGGARPPHRAERGAHRRVRRGRVQPAGVEQRRAPRRPPAARTRPCGRAHRVRPVGPPGASGGRAAGRRDVVRRRELPSVRASGSLVRRATRRARGTHAAGPGRPARSTAGSRRRSPPRFPTSRFPSRKDSQYATSLRQWRFAELCELGLARGGTPALAAMLAKLYDERAPRRRHRTRGVERRGRTQPPGGPAHPRRSGLEVAPVRARATPGGRGRRPAPACCSPARASPSSAAITTGCTSPSTTVSPGGGHGHPDRLNVLFSDRRRALARRPRHRVVRRSLAALVSEHAGAQRADGGRALAVARGRRAAGVRRAGRIRVGECIGVRVARRDRPADAGRHARTTSSTGCAGGRDTPRRSCSPSTVPPN